MDRINVGIIGTGWCGGIRADASAANPLVDELHIAEIREDRLEEVKAATNPVTATTDHRELLENPDIHAVMISATPARFLLHAGFAPVATRVGFGAAAC